MSPRREGQPANRLAAASASKAKHDILVKYLQAWFAIMGRLSV